METKGDKLLLRPVECADVLGLSRSKVYELLASRTLPHIRIGSSVRIPTRALRIWIKRQLQAERAERR